MTSQIRRVTGAKPAKRVGPKAQALLRQTHTPRETFHRSRPAASGQRLVQFLRIARGRLA